MSARTTTVWIAQSRFDRYWLIPFETKPTHEDLSRAAKGVRIEWAEWNVFRYRLHATAAGTAKRHRITSRGEGC